MDKITKISLVILIVVLGGIIALDKVTELRKADNENINYKLDKVIEKLDKVFPENGNNNRNHGSIGQTGP